MQKRRQLTPTFLGFLGITLQVASGLASPANAPTVAHPSAHQAWTVGLSSDGHFVELSYRGEKKVTELSVELGSAGKKLSSVTKGEKLNLAEGTKPSEVVVKVPSETSFEIELRSEDSSIVILLRGPAGLNSGRGVVHARLHAGSEPLQVRIDGEEDGIQQMVSGRGVSQLNDSVFDRFRDEALRVLARETHFSPAADGFRVAAGGWFADNEPICRFKIVDRVYENRLPYYKPLDKQRWPKVPVLWSSWYYYFAHVKEEDILRNAAAVARDYKPFGLGYVLVEAGWQVAGDGVDLNPIGGNWTEPNEKFPHGMKWLADRIHDQGLKAGLTLMEFSEADEKFYHAHPKWFLHDETGNAKLGGWYGTYIADFSNPVVKKYLFDLYRMYLLKWGYDYIKLDGENDTRDLFAKQRARAYDPTLDANTAWRMAFGLIRGALDSKPNVFLGACGPVYPTEAMGIAQSARLGDDVVADVEQPSFRGVRTALDAIRRGYYTHNIAWYGDPDVLVVRPPLTDDEARTWTSILGLTGQHLMLSDDMEALPENRRDMLRKIIPVADISPMDLYPAAADRYIWMLHIARPFGAWAVAGLFNWDSDGREMSARDESESYQILQRNDMLLGIHSPYRALLAKASVVRDALEENRRLEALASKPPGLQLLPVPAYLMPPAPRRLELNFGKVGLDPGGEYLLFDFWKQQFLGKIQGEYTVELPAHACQLVSIRTAENRPQLIGTDRHVTMGGVELQDEHWDPVAKELRVKVGLVENYATTLTVYTSASRFKEARASGANIQVTTEGDIIRAKLISPRSADVKVILCFE
jgi:hypothetical protein